MKTGLSRKGRTELHLSEHDWKQLYPRRKAGRRPHFAHMEKLTGPAPCFYFLVCQAYAVIAKDGKGVCRGCAEEMKGRMPHRQEYPLEVPNQTVRRVLFELSAKRGELHMPLKRGRMPASPVRGVR